MQFAAFWFVSSMREKQGVDNTLRRVFRLRQTALRAFCER